MAQEINEDGLQQMPELPLIQEAPHHMHPRAKSEEFLDPEGLKALWEFTYGNNPQNQKASSCPDESSKWEDEPELTAEERAKLFHDAKIRFKSLANPTLEERVLFEKLNREEETRRILLRSQMPTGQTQEAGEEQPEEVTEEPEEVTESIEDPVPEDTGNSIPEVEIPESPNDNTQDQENATERRDIRVTDKEQKIAMEIGLRELIGPDNALTQELYPEKKSATDRIASIGATGSNLNSSGPKRAKNNDDPIKSSRKSNRSFINNAQRNAAMPATPRSASRDKEKALSEIVKMVASIPNANTREASSDKQRILEATRKLIHKPTHMGGKDDEGVWSIPGLNTLLFHHQMLAVGWMREREVSVPQGGLFCDEMGLGKTLSAIANVVDDRKMNAHEKRAPTLIVVPSHLLGHWRHELSKHLNEEAIQDPRIFPVGFRQHEYDSPPKLRSCNNSQIFAAMDIVLTTYYRVSESYLPTKLPADLRNKDPRAITSWWIEKYKANVGPLHQFNWRRVILDEAHCIRNSRCNTSIAVRALTAEKKWVITGTPLFNGIDEFYAYFNLLREANSNGIENFRDEFNDGSDSSCERLVNMLRMILYRKTHESRLFGCPVIRLPNIREVNVMVDLCEAEKHLYERISEVFLGEVNRLSSKKAQQFQCILSMFLHLRMLASHVLTAQEVIQALLDDEDLNTLNKFRASENDSGDHSSEISRLIQIAKGKHYAPKGKAPDNDAEPTWRNLSKNPARLIRNFLEFVDKLDGDEPYERQKCPQCHETPDRAFVTSCIHVYCEECLESLPRSSELLQCIICHATIEELAYYNGFNNVSCHLHLSQSAKKRKPTSARGTPSKATKRSRNSMFSRYQNQENADDAEEESETQDWIPDIGSEMPGAKLTRLRRIMRGWLQDDPTTKVLIFTHFLNSVRLLEMLCEEENWNYTKIIGKMELQSRDNSIKKFQNDDAIRVMISTYKVGGTGLNLTAANKCILLDLWWNEAVEQQAYCRAFRIGQTREVEVIKLVANATIDSRMLEIQQGKTEQIQNVMSLKALEGRDTIRKLLRVFGEVQDVEGGGFKVIRTRKRGM